MPICTQCGQQNSEGTSRCTKCGVSLGGQVRARSDAKRTNVASAFTLLIRIVIAVAVIAAIYPTYRFAFSSYYKYRLNTVTEAATKTCGGPITSTTAAYQKDQIEKCLATDEALLKAQQDYDTFMNVKKS